MSSVGSHFAVGQSVKKTHRRQGGLEWSGVELPFIGDEMNDDLVEFL